jgi:hypothetical protein
MLVSNIGLHVSAQNDKTKLAWDFPDDFFSQTYCVRTDRLEKASARVRDVLKRVATAYVQATASYAPHLPALATEGTSLKTALFTSGANGYRHELEDYLGSRPAGTRLTIYSDSTVEVPWNFVFVGDNVQIPFANRLTDFKDFWLSRFKIRIRFSDGEFPPRKPITRDRVKTLLAIHQSRFRLATDLLTRTIPGLRDKIDRLLRYRVGPTVDWIDCNQKWGEIKDDDSILYIFAHRDDAGSLWLEERERVLAEDAYKYELDTNRFAGTFRKGGLKAGSNTLCFINGCRTVAGGWGNDLLDLTSGSGFQGFIGSEAEISSDWATRYAIEFLYALLEEGKSVDQAYEETRESCFPMSLWYSCCAQPGFRIVDG